MKTSNKILIAMLLFIVFAGTVVHLTLYARYRSRQFTSEAAVKGKAFDAHNLPAFRYVRVSGLPNLRIITAASPRLDLHKHVADRVHYEMKSDSLLVWGDTAEYLANKNNYGDIMEDRETDLYLLPGTFVAADHCIILINGAADSVAATSYRLSLSSSKIQLGGFWFQQEQSEYFNAVQIRASNDTEIRFSRKIDSLSADLTGSSLLDEGGRLLHLHLAADNNSTVSLTGKNLRLISPETIK